MAEIDQLEVEATIQRLIGVITKALMASSTEEAVSPLEEELEHAEQSKRDLQRKLAEARLSQRTARKHLHALAPLLLRSEPSVLPLHFVKVVPS